jgi:hypothetical protein
MALIGVVLVLAMLMGLAAALAMAVNSDTQLRGAFGRGVTGMYAAESGLNTGMGEFKNIFLDFNVPNGSDFDPRTFTIGNRTVTYGLTERAGNPQVITIPSGELFGGLNSIQYTYTVSSKAGVSADVEAEVGAEFNVNNIPLFQFVAFYIPDLEVLPGPDMRLHGRVHANEDLYLNAGNNLFIEDNPPGISTVQISTAGDVYRGRKNDSTCTGSVTVDKLEDTATPLGNLDPRVMPCIGGRRLVDPSELALWKGSIVSGIEAISVPDPGIINRGNGEFWERAELRIVLNLTTTINYGTAGSPVVRSAIEVQDVNGVRNTGKTNSLLQFMIDNAWNNANSTAKGTRPVFFTDVPNAGCNCTTQAYPTNCSNNVPTCYTPQLGTGTRPYAEVANINTDRDPRRGGYYNWREQSWMMLLNVNLRDLIAWNTANGQPFFNTNDTTDGGLVIFLSVQGPASNGQNNYGVRVFGSENIPLPGGIGVSADPTGVTVVSDQAMYVIGDYNRGPVGAGDLPKQPSALIGDSLNVMSSNYFHFPATIASRCADGCNCNIGGGVMRRRNDCQSTQSLADVNRDAGSTRVNAAFLSGVDETIKDGGNNAAYNGGLENYPRFHEDWGGGATLTYNGSFVSLGNPQHVNGLWCGTGGSSTSTTLTPCNIYNPPVRVWDYDSAFNNVANLPPLTPRFVYVQQVLFTESFK